MTKQTEGGKTGFSRRKFFKRLGIGAGAVAGAYVVPAFVAETFGPDGPEVDDPRRPSLYEKDVLPFPAVPVLESDLNVDVAVVGTGVTGLSTALALKALRPELKVCALDSHRPCSGASTRFSTHIFGRFYAWKKILKAEGVDAARRAVSMNHRVVEQFAGLLAENSIEADVRRRDFHIVGTAEQEEKIKSTFGKMEQVGLPARLLEGGQIEERLKTRHYQWAIEAPALAYVHPGKMMKGLLQLALDRGVEVYGESPMLEVENSDSDTETNILKTPRATVTARQVFFGTNAYTPRLNGLFSSRMIPLMMATVATRPLTEAEIAEIGIDFEAFIEAQLLSRSFGLTTDKRVFMRGILGYAAFRSAWWGDDRPERERIQRELRERLPWLAEVEMPEYWEGAVTQNVSGFPMSGPLKEKGQYASVCFNGNGVVDGYFTGHLVAHQMIGADHPDLGYLRSPYDTTAIMPHEPHLTIGAKTFFFFGL
jgi:glycine/D-amino acid oxidase-like deaminating enzyme